MFAFDRNDQAEATLSGDSLDYAIELLTFGKTDYANVNLKPTPEQFALAKVLVKRGFIAGNIVSDRAGAVTGILVAETTPQGVRFLERLDEKRRSMQAKTHPFALLQWLATRFFQRKNHQPVSD